MSSRVRSRFRHVFRLVNILLGLLLFVVGLGYRIGVQDTVEINELVEPSVKKSIPTEFNGVPGHEEN